MDETQFALTDKGRSYLEKLEVRKSQKPQATVNRSILGYVAEEGSAGLDDAYANFQFTEKEYLPYTITPNRFEKDLRKLLNRGYLAKTRTGGR